MSSPTIEALRSVALNVPDLARAESFYTQVWNLQVALRGDDAVYLRGSGSDHHLLALHPGGEAPQIRQGRIWAPRARGCCRRRAGPPRQRTARHARCARAA